MHNILPGLRAVLFYIGYSLATVWFSTSALIFVSWRPYAVRVRYLTLWNRAVVWWLQVTCGVRVRIEGHENIPAERPFVVLAKHQSQWETFFLPTLFEPICTALKQELLDLPFFGWGLRMVKPIAINRGSPKDALKQILVDGRKRLEEGICILLFPEGTRTDPGKSGRYARSGAELAITGGVPVIAVAHNAGECWPAHRFLKKPGLITIVISKPMLTTDQSSSRELMSAVESWIEAEVTRISAKQPSA